jgi:phospholipase C
MQTRRQFLTKSAFLASGAALSGNLLSAIRTAAAIEPVAGSTFWDAEHIIILMQENRSFDHAFGTLRGVRGFNDPRAITLPDGNPVWVQTNKAGESYAPFRLNIKDTNATWMGCLPHSWTDQVDARNDGKYDRWLDEKKSSNKKYANMPLTMGYYNREDIPFYYELADAFTICDQHFCSCLTGTTPNRSYLWSGTIRGQQNADSPANVLNSDIDHDANVSWPTFPERLEDLGVAWKVYQNEISVGEEFTDEEAEWLLNFGDNPLEYFTQYNVRLTPAHRQSLVDAANSLRQEIQELKQKADNKNGDQQQSGKLASAIQEKERQLQHLEQQRKKWNDENYDRLSPRDKSLLARAFCTNSADTSYRQLEELTYRDGKQERRVRVPKGDLLHQFRQDVERDQLPTVSWVVAPEKFSDHPGSAWYGAWYIAELLDILTNNPAVWKKTIFMLTYDENDGYFDHVPPFVAPDPRRPETGRVSNGIDLGVDYVTRESELKRKPPWECRDSSIGLGYRVPLVIASPWSRGGYVCSQVFDHTSPLQFLEKFLSKKLNREVREPNISTWRRAVCGDLTSTFHSAAANDNGRLTFPDRNTFIEQIHCAQFKTLPAGYHRLSPAEIDDLRRDGSKSALLPQQEPGVRPSCALPYDLAVDGRLSEDGKHFIVTFEAKRDKPGAAGAPFTAYARTSDTELHARNYAVAPGEKLEDAWPLADFNNQQYHVEVYGPNGFHRAFRGGSDDPPVEVCFRYKKNDNHRVAVAVEITNRDRRRHTVHAADVAYTSGQQSATLAPAGTSSLTFDCETSFGWYDLEVTLDSYPDFAKRYAGRIETGRESFSDPAMSGLPFGELRPTPIIPSSLAYAHVNPCSVPSPSTGRAREG